MGMGRTSGQGKVREQPIPEGKARALPTCTLVGLEETPKERSPSQHLAE